MLAFVAGVTIVVAVLLSSLRTLVLPRSAPDYIASKVFRAVRSIFDIALMRATTYGTRDREMALYAPVALLTLQAVWLSLVLVAYALMFWAVGAPSWREAFRLSGSSLLTLGFASAETVPGLALAFSEAALGLVLVALLIAYLPTMYAAFSRREAAVTMLEVRAGAPPSAVEMISRYNRIRGLDRLNELWVTWEAWFADVEETHTSLSALAFFRSPRADHSWVTAAGAVLDGASLVNSTVDVEHDPQADLCIRAGYVALRHIADFFQVKYDADPRAGDPISITREEFDDAREALGKDGVPLKPDAEQAWRDFAGWRVNYDAPLLALAELTMAPYAPWSSDRGLTH